MDGSVSSDPYLRCCPPGPGGSLRNAAPCCTRVILGARAVTAGIPQARGALFGFPGSGNILAKHLIDELWRRLDAPPPLPVVLAGNFAEHYYVSTAVLMRPPPAGPTPRS